MRIVRAVQLVWLGSIACSPPSTYSTGSGGPVPWTPGRYVLEATVGRGSMSDEEFRAILTVAPDGSTSLSASTGLCRDPSPSRAETDESLGLRTFQCGDAVYYVQPSATGVRGRIVASVLEEYEAQVPCAPTSNQATCTIMRTRRVTRIAQLTVSSLD
jgi:hypothetical protein